ncbi:Cation-dependent mannose-6-phosphate receptor [Eufriesea mexicana]|uniref:Cation-dependent mannose-6-phosphate receptor n=2 Tax=Eufriesea mexicana TaxID=516756 RepID=A0A310S7F7_9HYME|nr:PREDICTED: cation-dependent mannose-6-phosphate receptor-like isoform X2 [Eufriesea mexicana]OAD52378.1 Cation-dependent mannose-6-phosphate receptor [Eufriesea mexicana]
MTKKNELLFIFGLFLISFCEQTSSECRQLTACSCTFPNGQGYTLLPLASSSPLLTADPNHNYTFYFHPCTNTVNFPSLPNNVSNNCHKGNGVSLCAEHDGTSFVLGKAEDTKIILEADNSKPPIFILDHDNYSTTIALACCNVCKTTLTLDSIDDKRYHLLLSSPYACKTFVQSKGLSISSTLLILFFVFTGLYFIGGAMILKCLRGATGWEMVPNHRFWKNFLSLVKDGIVFTFNCCRVDSYERI